MAREFAKGFYASAAWRKCRAAYFEHAKGLCEHCGDPGYIVDHITELTPENINDPYVTLNFENLQLLCLPCHNRKTFQKRYPTREGLMFDEDGNLVQVGNTNT